jgi:hypothetical protein
MRKLALSLIVAFAFYVSAAAAQAGAGPRSQGTQGSSPNMQQPGATQPGAAQPGTAGQSPDMGPGANDQTGTTANTNSNKGEKKIKGCVESQNGQYVLLTKKGNVALAGQDVSAHVGHEVSLKGTWDNSGANPNASPTASSSGEAMSKGTFNVTEVKMESEQCKIKSKDHSGSVSPSGAGSGAGSNGAPPQ